MRRADLLCVVLLLFGCAAAQTEYKPNAAKVMYIPARQLQMDIGKAPERTPGLRDMQVVKENNYSVVVASRTKPSLAEVHKQVTDVWYVIDGRGTIITGGSLTDVTEPSPGEVRGRSVSGGKERQIAKGDVLRIPNGVPHWISKIDGSEIVYMVVKVTSAQ
jgi:mannose-6-phosphate isomerase-like protein (cupin superfamily)